MSPVQVIFLIVGLLITALLAYAAFRNQRRSSTHPRPHRNLNTRWRRRFTDTWNNIHVSDARSLMDNQWFVIILGILLIHLVLWFSLPNVYSFVTGLGAFWIGHLVVIFLVASVGHQGPVVLWVKRVLVSVWLLSLVVALTSSAVTRIVNRHVLTVTERWSRTIEVPSGYHLDWEWADDAGAYDVQVFPSGSTYSFSRNNFEHRQLPETRVTSLRFRASSTETEPVRLKLTYTKL
jgi:hypothetical protein